MWPLSLINLVPRSITHLQCIELVSPERLDHIIPLLSYDYAMTSKRKNNFRDTFKFQIKIIVYLSNHRMMHCLEIGFKNCILLKPLNSMLEYVVEILSLQKLEYKM